MALQVFNNLKLAPEKLLTIPLDKKQLALKFKENCVAKIMLETKVEKLLSLNLTLLDLNTDQALASSLSYFNTIGQLIASSSKIGENEIFTNGIREIELTNADRKLSLNGPITSTWGESQISLEYAYGFRSGQLDRYLSLLNQLSIVDLNDCKTMSEFNKLIEDFKNA